MRTIAAGAAVPLALAAPAADTPGERAQADAVRTDERPGGRGHLIVRVRRGEAVRVHARPRGRVVGRLVDHTEFGSPQYLPVLERRGAWLGVATTQGPNGGVGWVHMRRSALSVTRTEISLRADLSDRVVELRRGRRVVARVRVAVGRPGSATPTGRFAVTDKIPGRRFSRYYGCCILALSGRQPNPPPGWSGGDRLAIHGTNAPGAVGKASSAGCLRAHDRPLRRLMRQVPLGAPVTIRA